MPVMNGLTATSKIREFERDRSLRPAVIMAVTGVASSEMQREALSCGVNEYLIKPISLSNIRKVMNIE
jgi:CheY-like chemotaxis protein